MVKLYITSDFANKLVKINEACYETPTVRELAEECENAVDEVCYYHNGTEKYLRYYIGKALNMLLMIVHIKGWSVEEILNEYLTAVVKQAEDLAAAKK